jgi:hypothetical protein
MVAFKAEEEGFEPSVPLRARAGAWTLAMQRFSIESE